MLTIFVRVVILYAVSVLAMRLMGKRQVGQLQPYELVLALMVAEIAAAPMEDVAIPLLHGLVPILGLLFLHGVCTAWAVKSQGARRMMFGVPGVVIREGNLDFRQMRKMGYTITDLLEELRGLGYADVSRVHTAILETNGRLSAFPKAAFAPVALADFQVDKPDEKMPRILISDGRVQQRELEKSGHDGAWLAGRMAKAGIGSEKQVLLASLNGEGQLFLQPKAGPARILPGEGGR